MAEASQHWDPPPPFREGGHTSKGKSKSAPGMGQVAGVAKGHQGTVWVFHRAGRVWDSGSFADGGAGEATLLTEPIAQDVVLQLDQESGRPAPLLCNSCCPSFAGQAPSMKVGGGLQQSRHQCLEGGDAEYQNLTLYVRVKLCCVQDFDVVTLLMALGASV